MSKKETSFTYAASNAITILNQAQFIFNFMDLSGVCIPEANLSQAMLTGANLSKANLQGVNFRQAHLQNCNMSLSNLTGV